MQRGYEGHLQFAEKRQDVAARATAVDAVFMLQANKVVAVEVEKVGSTLVGVALFLLQFQAHLIGVIVLRMRIVHGDSKQTFLPVLSRKGSAEVGGKRRNSALAGEIVPHECDARGQRNRR